PGLMLAGALTGALAAGQRFLGFWTPPVTVPEPRFAATALMGNPGHVGAALVIPVLLLWCRLWSSQARGRTATAVGLAAALFGHAFVPARLAAEARAKRRLVHATETAHFENAHSEPLTAAAECGLPAALVAGAVVAWLLASLFGAARREKGLARDEVARAEML